MHKKFEEEKCGKKAHIFYIYNLPFKFFVKTIRAKKKIYYILSKRIPGTLKFSEYIKNFFPVNVVNFFFFNIKYHEITESRQ